MNVNDVVNFAQQVQFRLAGWLLPGNILVLDNATIHYGDSNSDLENWLWQYFLISFCFGFKPDPLNGIQ
jgi:hypothetical protein